jgi:NAD-dependent dihydropyrimidine dehydrogenase PreA subunit
MAKRITVVISQGQSANPAKRKLEEDLVGALLFERGVEVTVVPHLYDLAPDGTGMLCLQGITGDMVVLSWLYRRAAHWLLDRNGVRGHMGHTLLEPPADDEDEDETADREAAESEAQARPRVIDDRPLPARKIYCLDLRWHDAVTPYVEEVRRIASEATVQTVDLLGFIGGTPRPEQLQRFVSPAAGNVDAVPLAGSNGQGNGHASQGIPNAAAADVATNGELALAHEPVRIIEEAGRRWYPVIDFSRCTNCMECLDFCLFGVYGVDRAETILVEQPDNCRKGCPACSRVCPENAIIFPQHKSPAIAGSPEVAAGAFKIDLSKLFGAPEGLDAAVSERDAELVAAGRDAVGATVGMPKRQSGKPTGPKDDLDSLMDQLDSLDL